MIDAGFPQALRGHLLTDTTDGHPGSKALVENEDLWVGHVFSLRIHSLFREQRQPSLLRDLVPGPAELLCPPHWRLRGQQGQELHIDMIAIISESARHVPLHAHFSIYSLHVEVVTREFGKTLRQSSQIMTPLCRGRASKIRGGVGGVTASESQLTFVP